MSKPPSLSSPCFGQRAIMPFAAALFFALLFAGFSLMNKPDVSVIQSQAILDIFQKWSVFAGAAFGFLSMLGMYLFWLFGLRRLRLAGPILLLLGYLPWLAFGYNLVYLEPRYAAIAIAIILFFGKPLLYASAVIVGLGILGFLFLLLKNPKTSPLTKILFVPLIALPLSGCLGELMGVLCDFFPDSDHCFQSAAVQKADPYGCEKIKGEGFKGSNPPRDKCYLMIAENTGDYSACDYIKGGPMSYTKEDCIFAAAVKHDDPKGCRMLTGLAFENCKHDLSQNITTDKLAGIAEEIENAKSALGADPDSAKLKKQLADLEAKKKDLYDFASSDVQNQYFKESREKIMEDIDDDDVKSVIARQFMDYRSKHPNEDMDQLLKKMEQIKENQEYVKNLDDQVNELFDEMKGNVTDFVTENVDEATGASEFAEEMQERGLEWFKEKGGDRVKRGIENLEWMKEKYDKASEQYEEIAGQIEKLKKAYDEAYAVYKKVDAVNKLVAEGKIDKGKAGVLHGAILLSKGLEYATEYVPVFGSTISKISTATFETTIKLATERAKRTTAIDKCIEDPEHCDTEGITGY